jgi:hypothetical protein
MTGRQTQARLRPRIKHKVVYRRRRAEASPYARKAIGRVISEAKITVNKLSCFSDLLKKRIRKFDVT